MTAYYPLRAEVYDFAKGRTSKNAQGLLAGWRAYSSLINSNTTGHFSRLALVDLWANKMSPATEDALIRFVGEACLPLRDNHIKKRIRHIEPAVRRMDAGEEPAPTMTNLISSANPNTHDPYIHLKGVFERPPTQPASGI